MNDLLAFGLVFVSFIVAAYLGRRLGKRFVRGRLSTGWVLVLSAVIALISAWAFIFLLHLPVEYIFWTAGLLGGVANGAEE